MNTNNRKRCWSKLYLLTGLSLLLIQSLAATTIQLGYLSLDRNTSQGQQFTVVNISGTDPLCSSVNLACDPLAFSNSTLEVGYLDANNDYFNVVRTFSSGIASDTVQSPPIWFFDMSFTIQTARFLADLSPVLFTTGDGYLQSDGIVQSGVVDFANNNDFGLLTTEVNEISVIPEPSEVIPTLILMGGLTLALYKRR